LSRKAFGRVFSKHAIGLSLIKTGDWKNYNSLKMNDEKEFIPHQIARSSESEQLERSASFRQFLDRRRTVRTFSDEPVAREVVENILMAASTAPSGAHKQPWFFCAVQSAALKKRIRIAAEKEEYKSYTERMSEEWKKDLEKLKTNWEKPFLEQAPWLIAVFMKPYDLTGGEKRKNYYVKESVGLATGMLLTAAFHAGLATLTYTPSPMGFLAEVLERPQNEKPYMLIPMGFPSKDTVVPNLKRKTKEEVIRFFV
jgi:iodotyrosine deiodinase